MIKIKLMVGNVVAIGEYKNQGGHNFCYSLIIEGEPTLTGSTGAKDTSEAFTILQNLIVGK